MKCETCEHRETCEKKKSSQKVEMERKYKYFKFISLSKSLIY